MVSYFVILRIGTFPNQKLTEGKWLILEFNMLSIFFQIPFFFFFFLLLLKYSIQGQYYFQFLLAIQIFILFCFASITVSLISHHILGPVPHISPFLVGAMPVECIERLTVHKVFIVGILLVYHSLCVWGWHNILRFCCWNKNCFQKSHFPPKGQV